MSRDHVTAAERLRPDHLRFRLRPMVGAWRMVSGSDHGVVIR